MFGEHSGQIRGRHAWLFEPLTGACCTRGREAQFRCKPQVLSLDIRDRDVSIRERFTNGQALETLRTLGKLPVLQVFL